MADRRTPLRARLSRGLSATTERLGAHRTALGLLVLALAGFLAYVAFVSTTGPPFQSRYELQVRVPAEAPVMRPGQAVRVGGRLAGLVSAVEPDREAGASVVTANITKPAFRPLPADTEAYVRVHSIVYETYLELRPGDSPRELAHGERLAAPAASGVDLLEAVELFDERTREALSRTVVSTGFGLAGRGPDLNAAFAELPDTSRDLAGQLRAATREQGALGDLVAGGADTSRGLRGGRPDDLAGLIASGEQALGAVAERRTELGEAIRRLRPFEDELIATAPVAEPLLDDVAALARDLGPAVRSLNATLPSLERLFAFGPTMREEGARIARVADPLLDAARPVVFGLFPTMTALRPLNRDLANLKATVDPYKPEIRRSGLRMADATSHRYPQGLAPGAPALRIVPVFGPRHCQNPIPDPGEAERDRC